MGGDFNIGQYNYNHINEIRDRKHLSFDDIAKKSGLSKGHICNVANFKVIPNQLSIAKISYSLGERPEAVFEFDIYKLNNNK